MRGVAQIRGRFSFAFDAQYPIARAREPLDVILLVLCALARERLLRTREKLQCPAEAAEVESTSWPSSRRMGFGELDQIDTLVRISLGLHDDGRAASKSHPVGWRFSASEVILGGEHPPISIPSQTCPRKSSAKRCPTTA